ncbi:hypothetical protein SODG_006849 [Sodalis praecaptivus]
MLTNAARFAMTAWDYVRVIIKYAAKMLHIVKHSRQARAGTEPGNEGMRWSKAPTARGNAERRLSSSVKKLFPSGKTFFS